MQHLYVMYRFRLVCCVSLIVNDDRTIQNVQQLLTHSPWHDCSEARPKRDGPRGSEGLPSTAEASFHAPIHTVGTN